MSTTYIVLGPVLIVLGFLGTGSFIGLGIVFLAIGIWARSSEPLKIFEDNFELKVAPLAPLKKILFKEIESLSMDKRKIMLRALVNGKSKTLRIPFNLFHANDRDEVRLKMQEVFNHSRTAPGIED